MVGGKDTRDLPCAFSMVFLSDSSKIPTQRLLREGVREWERRRRKEGENKME